MESPTAKTGTSEEPSGSGEVATVILRPPSLWVREESLRFRSSAIAIRGNIPLSIIHWYTLRKTGRLELFQNSCLTIATLNSIWMAPSPKTTVHGRNCRHNANLNPACAQIVPPLNRRGEDSLVSVARPKPWAEVPPPSRNP